MSTKTETLRRQVLRTKSLCSAALTRAPGASLPCALAAIENADPLRCVHVRREADKPPGRGQQAARERGGGAEARQLEATTLNPAIPFLSPPQPRHTSHPSLTHSRSPASSRPRSADPYNPASARRPDPAAVARSFLADIAVLARIPTYVMLGVAWAMHTATIGCFSYYGPKAAKELFQLDAADSVFGALTVVTGIMGTLMGGMLLDRWKCASARLPPSLPARASRLAARFDVCARSETAETEPPALDHSPHGACPPRTAHPSTRRSPSAPSPAPAASSS